MHSSPFAFLLADIEGFFGIVFMLIAIVGWVINLVNQNAGQDAKNQQRRRPPRPQGQRSPGKMQREIDQFLKQSGKAGGAEQLDDVEIIAPPARRRPPKRRRTREEILAEQRGETIPATPRPAGKQPARQPSRKSTARKTFQPPKASSIAEQVEKDLPHAIDQSVAEHLHQFTADSPTATGQQGILSTTLNRPSKAPVLRRLLTSRDSVRDAIILNEILSRPKSLRNS